MAEPVSLRLFFALWPDEPTTRRLAELQRSLRPVCPGRWLRAENLHVTLVFLGQVAAGRLPELKCLAERVHCPPFSLSLNRLQWWRGNRLLCLAPGVTPVGLSVLVAELSAGLAAAGFELESRTYRAHLTLARQVAASDRLPGQSDPIVLEANAFSLMESRATPAGPRYLSLETWPLASRDWPRLAALPAPGTGASVSSCRIMQHSLSVTLNGFQLYDFQ